MDRMACVDLPALPLQRLLRDHPEWEAHPAAVVDRDKSQGRLLWVNEAARRKRILPGMRFATALALDRELRAGMVAAAEIRATVEELVAALRIFSAGVEPSAEEPGVFWLDASGLSLLYPSLLRWARLLRGDLLARGWIAYVGVGFSRLGTFALARGEATRDADGVCIAPDPGQERQRAAVVPLSRLDLPPTARDALYKLGVTTLGELVALPASGVRRRFGEQVHHLHRLADGEFWSPLQPLAQVEPVRTCVCLEHGERDLDRLCAVLGAELAPLLHTLALRQQLLRSIVLDLRHEKAPPRTERLHPAEPTLRATILLELLRLRLEGAPLADEVIEVALELEGVAATPGQIELFALHPGRDPAAASRALARVRAMLGEEAVCTAQIVDAHLPEARVRWQPLEPEALAPASPRDVRHPPLVRRMRARALPLSRQRRDEPDGWMILGLEGGAVEEVIGPYVVSGGWWVREVHRELYYVRTARSGWLWVYFDRRRRRWFLLGDVE